jgi:hypothetical protein
MPGSSKLCVSVQVSQTKAMHNSFLYACYTPYLSHPWSLKQNFVKSRDCDSVRNTVFTAVTLGCVVWNIAVCGSSAGIVIVCMLDHMQLFSKQQLKTPFYPEQQTGPRHIWLPVQWMLFYLRYSWCMWLITHLCFLLCLWMCAFVTVLPVCLDGVHRDMFSFYHCFVGMSPISTWT